MSHDIKFNYMPEMTSEQEAKKQECIISSLKNDIQKRLDALETTVKTLKSEIHARKSRQQCDICGDSLYDDYRLCSDCFNESVSL